MAPHRKKVLVALSLGALLGSLVLWAVFTPPARVPATAISVAPQVFTGQKTGGFTTSQVAAVDPQSKLTVSPDEPSEEASHEFFQKMAIFDHAYMRTAEEALRTVMWTHMVLGRDTQDKYVLTLQEDALQRLKSSRPDWFDWLLVSMCPQLYANEDQLCEKTASEASGRLTQNYPENAIIWMIATQPEGKPNLSLKNKAGLRAARSATDPWQVLLPALKLPPQTLAYAKSLPEGMKILEYSGGGIAEHGLVFLARTYAAPSDMTLYFEACGSGEECLEMGIGVAKTARTYQSIRLADSAIAFGCADPRHNKSWMKRCEELYDQVMGRRRIHATLLQNNRADSVAFITTWLEEGEYREIQSLEEWRQRPLFSEEEDLAPGSPKAKSRRVENSGASSSIDSH